MNMEGCLEQDLMIFENKVLERVLEMKSMLVRMNQALVCTKVEEKK